MKKLKKMIITTEVQTSLSMKEVKKLFQNNLNTIKSNLIDSEVIEIKQIQTNVIKEVKN